MGGSYYNRFSRSRFGRLGLDLSGSVKEQAPGSCKLASKLWDFIDCGKLLACLKNYIFLKDVSALWN